MQCLCMGLYDINTRKYSLNISLGVTIRVHVYVFERMIMLLYSSSLKTHIERDLQL